MRRVTTPERRADDRAVLAGRVVERGARVDGGALAFSSLCSSRLQIGQLAVRRLWRQKRDTGAAWVVAARARRPRRGSASASPTPGACAPRAAGRGAAA